MIQNIRERGVLHVAVLMILCLIVASYSVALCE